VAFVFRLKELVKDELDDDNGDEYAVSILCSNGGDKMDSPSL
jgi:hypothetical protein